MRLSMGKREVMKGPFKSSNFNVCCLELLCSFPWWLWRLVHMIVRPVPLTANHRPLTVLPRIVSVLFIRVPCIRK